MTRRLPPEAFAYYLGLGVGRSYGAVADKFGVSKTAVANLAAREGWQARAAEIDRKAADAAVAKSVESLEAMNDRHLRSLRAIQGKALEALRTMSLTDAMDAVRALDLAIRQERVIRGEPSERTALEVEDVIRREYERWMVPPAPSEAAAPPPPDSHAPEKVPEPEE
jgi:hypothetical protein